MGEEKKLPDIWISNYGLYATHNMPCAIYNKQSAVFDCQQDYFQPSWKAQQCGWITIRIPNRTIRELVKKLHKLPKFQLTNEKQNTKE